MRTFAAALALLLGVSVARAEVIIIHEKVTPPVQPKPKKDYFHIAPPYSDYAMEHDTWSKAWLLLDIDAAGQVARLKLLHAPGADLDRIAIEQGFKLSFDPAQDGRGNRVGSQVIWPIEWVGYWWMVDFTGLATRIPDNVVKVPCAGSGPMHVGSYHPAYRDCTPAPDPSTADDLPWITRASLEKQ